MNHELSEEIFKNGTRFCQDEALLSVRSWRVVSVTYPVLEIEFAYEGRSTIRVKMLCNDWDELPPSVELLDKEGVPLAQFPVGKGHSVFNNSSHPRTQRPFLCIPGVREYHEHTSHVSDTWENYKNKSGYDLGGILTRTWDAWKNSE